MKATIEQIVEIINSSIERIQITQEQADDDLMQLGLDSINCIALIVALEEAFACEIPDEKLLIVELNTVQKIFAVLKSIEDE